MKKTVRQRALMADLPKGISIYRDKSGPDSRGNRVAGYFVRVGKKFSGQKPTRKFVHDLKEAGNFIAGLKPHADVMKTSQLTPQQLAETILCIRTLEEKKTSLSLLDAVELALRYHDPEGGRRTISQVAQEMVKRATARGTKTNSVAQLKSLLKNIESEFGERLLASITTTEIEDWLDESEWAPRTRNNYLKQASQLYGFAIKRRYANANPCDSIDSAIEDDTTPGILTPDELRKLLDAAKEGAPELMKFIALGAFGWTRRSEICALENSDFRDDGTIHIRAAIAKTRQNRFIPQNDTLSAWLAIAPESNRPTRSKNPDVMGERLSALAAKAKIVIPHNALRHSAISYALACAPVRTVNGETKPVNNSTGEIAKYAGNSENVIVRNYRALVTEAQGKAYWQVLP